MSGGGKFCEQYRELNRTGRCVEGLLLEKLGYQHTMIGRARLENVAACLESIRREGVPGDLIECGVWRKTLQHYPIVHRHPSVGQPPRSVGRNRVPFACKIFDTAGLRTARRL